MSKNTEDMVNQLAEVLMADGGDAAQDMAQAVADEEERECGEDGLTPLTEDQILNIVTTELANSVSGSYSSETDANREESLHYYLGTPRGDEREGRSTIISTDVADAIEWILPQIIKALTSKGPVISFDSTSEDDETQSELETEFTHDVFMKENPGFLNLYTFVKDALMHKNGVFKIYYDTTDDVSQEQYTGLNDQELQMLSSDPRVTIDSMTQTIDEQAVAEMQRQFNAASQQLMQQPDPGIRQSMSHQLQQMQQQPPPMLSDVTVTITETKGQVAVECIPLEEFRVAKYHNSLDLSKARFSAHVTLKTRSDLIEEDYDPDIINAAEADTGDSDRRDFRFTEQGEDTGADRNYTEDKSQDLMEVSECVIMIDLEGTGIASLQKITVLGSDDATEILDIEPVTEVPFVSSTTIIMSHKFMGLSIYDRLKQLQDQKTSLWRNIMDNLYLQNNREKEVVEKNVNIDDLLVSRPGGIKRVKVAGSIRELEVQPIGQEGYQMLGYLDTVRTGRVGVSPDTAGVQPVMGSNVGSEGVERLMTAKEELTGLMVRVIAETGLKEAYKMVRNLLVRNHNSVTAFKFKGKWANVDPTQWGDRSRITVMVGTGTGDDARRQAAVSRVLDYQNKLVMDPRQTLVDMPQIYKALDTFCVTAGLPGADEYFLDPESEDGQAKTEEKARADQSDQAKADQANKQIVDAQTMLGQAEQMKGQAALKSQEAKLVVERVKSEQAQDKQEYDARKTAMEMEIDTMKTQLQAVKDGQKQQFDYAKLAAEMNMQQEKLQQEEALKLTDMEMEHKRDLSAQHEANKEGDDDADVITE